MCAGKTDFLTSAPNAPTRDKARRIAVNIAKLAGAAAQGRGRKPVDSWQQLSRGRSTSPPPQAEIKESAHRNESGNDTFYCQTSCSVNKPPTPPVLFVC